MLQYFSCWGTPNTLCLVILILFTNEGQARCRPVERLHRWSCRTRNAFPATPCLPGEKQSTSISSCPWSPVSWLCSHRMSHGERSLHPLVAREGTILIYIYIYWLMAIWRQKMSSKAFWKSSKQISAESHPLIEQLHVRKFGRICRDRRKFGLTNLLALVAGFPWNSPTFRHWGLEINGDCSLASGGSEAGVSLNLWQSRLSQLGDSFWHVG